MSAGGFSRGCSRHEEVVFDRNLHRCCYVCRVAAQWEGNTANGRSFLLPRLVQRTDSYVDRVPNAKNRTDFLLEKVQTSYVATLGGLS